MKNQAQIKIYSVFNLILLMAIFVVAVAGQNTDEIEVETVELARGVGMNFVTIPAGEFLMGSNKEAPNVAPAHKVTISRDFGMGQTEVTQAQWTALMGNDSREWLRAPFAFKNCPQCPVDYVSWNDAQEFLKKLNNLNDGYLYRLPTEAEWEYACRAGSTTTWSFGDDQKRLGDHAWFEGNTKSIQRVGQKKANDFGLYDMYGNVWELVHDYSGPYQSGSVTDPTGPAAGSDKWDHLSYGVIRGGGFYSPTKLISSATRTSITRGERPSGRDLGFRVVRQSLEESN
ncbi:MAG TPA: formylglycine-generating enzyme family protein [Pyrinomonadaceae bacterium]|nr:formylglycine-generating enzyme family protein [Pyrinomonadaceae bacterium]